MSNRASFVWRRYTASFCTRMSRSAGVVHTFSTTPTLHWVDGGRRSWCAPCIWCALGIATLAGGHVTIHTRICAESKSLVIDGCPADRTLFTVHLWIQN